MNAKYYDYLYMGFFALIPLLGFFSHKLVWPVLLLLGIGALVSRWRDGAGVLLENKPMLSLIALGALGILSALWSSNPGSVIEKGAELLALILFGIIALIGLGGRSSTILKFLPYSTVVLLVLTYIEVLFHYPILSMLGKIEPDSTPYLDGLNYMILFLGILVFPVTFLLNKKHGGIVASVFFIATAILIFMCVNMAAFLGLVGGVVVYLLAKLSRQLTLSIVFISLVVGLWLSPLIAKAAFDMRPETLVAWKTAHAGHRLEIWAALSHKAFERPITGFGLNAAKRIEHLDYQKIIAKFESVSHPHNFMIQVWLDLGLLGVIFVSSFFISLSRLWREKVEDTVFPVQIASFIAVLSSAMFSYGVWQTWWIAVMFTTALILVALQKKQHNIDG